jgi:hypothetical protein
MTATTQTHLTITLTGRPPVRIDKAEWPILATANGDSYGSGDYSRHQQALGCGELDRYRLTVRQHADGRAVVYGVLDAALDRYRLTVRQHADGRAVVYGVLDAATAWTHSEDYRGGELLGAGADLASAIRRVGEDCGLPGSLIRDCTADLPAVEI